MRHKGRITTWRDDKGFGFITPMAGGDRVFVHIKAFGRHAVRPEEGDLVVYTPGKDQRGRIRANTARPADVKSSRGAVEKPRTGSRRLPAARIAGSFFLLMAALVAITPAPLIIIAVYLVLSLVSYGLYAWDKGSAQRGVWRTRENTLHLFDLLGGWPGGLLAQQRLRHKCSKPEFQWFFWITVVVNCAALAWLLTPDGAGIFEQLVGELLQ